MLKQVFERQYFNKKFGQFYYNIPKSIECISTKTLNNTQVCSDLTLDNIENKYLLCGFVDGNIIIYNIETFLENRPAKVFSMNDLPSFRNTETIRCIQWYPVDNGLYFTCSVDRKLRIWDANKGLCVEQIPLMYNTNWISLSPCATSINVVAVGCDKNKTILIDLVSGSATHVLTDSSLEPVVSLQWSNREEHILVTGDKGGRVTIWDVRASRRALFHLDQYQDSRTDSQSNCQAHGGSIRGIEFSPDGLAIATLGSDDRVNVWDLYSNKAKLMDVNFGNAFKCSLPTRNIRFCWTGYSTYKKLWIPSKLDIVRLNMEDGSIQNFPSLHFDQITSCLWSKGYHQFFTASLDSNILNWKSVL